MYLESNLTLMVSDFNRSVRFYTEMLGLKLKARHGDGWAEVEAPGITIGLHPSGKSGHEPDDHHHEHASGIGTASIGLQVKKLEPVMDELKKKGVVFQPEIMQG